MDKQRDIKSIYQQARRYWHDWFPNLPGYTAYVQRLNRLTDTFPALAESLCSAQAPMGIAGLVDSFPIVMAQHSRLYHAKVAPDYANCGYCPSKKLYYYGVKLHLIGDRRAGTLSMAPIHGIDRRWNA